MHNLSQDPLFWTKEDTRLDLRVGEEVLVGGRRGRVVALCQDPSYPVKVRLEGETRESRPIFHSMKRPGEQS